MAKRAPKEAAPSAYSISRARLGMYEEARAEFLVRLGQASEAREAYHAMVRAELDYLESCEAANCHPWKEY